jgi:uncharacterized protein (TIGR03435 family)
MLTVKHRAAGVLLVGMLAARAGAAQDKLEFEVASVKENKSGAEASRSNVPLGPGNVFTPIGGHFSALNFPLATYIAFAYKLMGNQQQSLLSQFPDWVTQDRFDIEARVDGDPTKDQLRLMMRSLLAERFKLTMHAETRQVPIFALLVQKRGKLAPQFQMHTEDPPCSTVPSAQNTQFTSVFPPLCGGLLGMPPSVPGRQHVGARNVTMDFVANSLAAMANLDRPVFDKTGFTGTFDFALEWEPEPNALLAAAVDPSDHPGPAFLDAVQEQLGLKLESQKGPVEILIFDHAEHPSEN